MDNSNKKFLGLQRNVFTLGWVSFFMDVSSEMIYPLMPLFLTNILGVNKTIVGLIEGIAESTASLLKVVSGYISDRMRKRKPLILYGYGLSTFTRPILALAATWMGVLIYRFIDRIGKGIRTAPRDAIIAESTETDPLGRAFGYHRKFLSLSFTDVNFRKFLVVVSIFTLGNFSNAFIILKIQDVGGSLLNVTTIYLLFNAVYSVSSLPAGIAADYFGKKRMILSSYILFGLIYTGFAFAVSQVTVWILFLLYGIFMGISEGQQRAFVATLIPDNAKGTGYGVYHTMIGLITLPSSFIAGLLRHMKGPPAPF